MIFGYNIVPPEASKREPNDIKIEPKAFIKKRMNKISPIPNKMQNYKKKSILQNEG